MDQHMHNFVVKTFKVVNHPTMGKVQVSALACSCGKTVLGKALL